MARTSKHIQDKYETLHHLGYLVSLTIWIYTVLYLFTIDVILYQVKVVMFRNVQTTTSTFVGKI
jgi:hypothetical protein